MLQYYDLNLTTIKFDIWNFSALCVYPLFLLASPMEYPSTYPNKVKIDIRTNTTAYISNISTKKKGGHQRGDRDTRLPKDNLSLPDKYCKHS